jgi:hypothetical protein
VAKRFYTLPAFSPAPILLGLQAMGQISGNQQPSIAASFVGSSLTCSQSLQYKKVTFPRIGRKERKTQGAAS